MKINPPMDFSTAIRKVIDGKKITRIDWAKPEAFGYLKDNILHIRLEDGLDHQWILSEEDLLAFDWVLAE